MLEGVGYEVVCHLHHLLAVEPHRHRCRHVKLKGNVVACGIFFEEHNRLAQEEGEVVVMHVDACVALLLLTEVEQLGD